MKVELYHHKCTAEEKSVTVFLSPFNPGEVDFEIYGENGICIVSMSLHGWQVESMIDALTLVLKDSTRGLPNV